MKISNKPAEIHVDPKGFVMLTIAGDLLEKQMPDFDEALKAGSELICGLSEKQGAKVKVLMDVSAFSGNYTAEAVERLVDFAASNVPFVERSASFGGNEKVRAAGEIARALANRDNIAIFDTKAKAMKWLGI